MAIGTGMCCAKCQTYFVPMKNSVFVLETMDDGESPYKLWQADLLICPDCDHWLIAGFGFSPIAEHYQPNFDDMLKKAKASGYYFVIKGCPRAPVRYETKQI